MSLNKNYCEKSTNGKHKFRKEAICYDEMVDSYGNVIYKKTVFANKCLKCGKWGKVFNNYKYPNEN